MERPQPDFLHEGGGFVQAAACWSPTNLYSYFQPHKSPTGSPTLYSIPPSLIIPFRS